MERFKLIEGRFMEIKRLITMIAGLIVAYVGWAMWQEPELDINVLYILLLKEIKRMIEDPFAILGLIVMFFGIAAVVRASMKSSEE